MKTVFLFFILFLANVSLANGSKADKERLSWSPYDHLRKGFRNAPWIRDPFFPHQKRFHLTGIISNELAYINGRWLQEGDEVNGYVVKTIHRRQVTLAREIEGIAPEKIEVKLIGEGGLP